MKYIIENANVLSDTGIDIRSFLIENNKISHYGKSLEKYQAIRMDASSYFMTAGHTICDLRLPCLNDLEQWKDEIKHLIGKGCTTVLVPIYIQYENDFQTKIKEARHSMINSTIDYVLGIQLPVEKLTPSIVRLCKRHLVPFILVDVHEHSNLSAVPWGWIRDAQFQFQVPIYPNWQGEDRKILHQQMELWKDYTNDNRIPTYLHFPVNQEIVAKEIRKQIGLYPKKGELLIGNELDYNLYKCSFAVQKVEDSNKVYYDKTIPIITVHKGRLIKVCEETYYHPGFGEEYKVKKPGLFGTIDF